MDGEVRVPLPVAQLGIGDAPVLVALGVRLAERERAQRLCQDSEVRDPHRGLARPGPEHAPLHADVVAEVQELHEPVGLVADVVAPHVELNASRPVLDVRERRLAVPAERYQATRHPDRDLGLGIERRERLGRRVGPLVAVRVRVDAPRAERVQRLPAHGLQVRLCRPAHAALPPKRFRKVLMNSSRSPSITACTSPTFSSVRWSFTMV